MRNSCRLSWEVDDTPETIEQWVEGSVHLISDISGTGLAYRYLSRADEYLGYTYRRQYHTLWRYATAIMLLGVADAAGGKVSTRGSCLLNAGRRCPWQKSRNRYVFRPSTRLPP